jgi:hypothetical protein
MPKSKVETTLPCPSCRSPVDEHLDFCHACGENVVRVPVKAKQKGRPSLVMLAAALLGLAISVIMVLTINDFIQQYGLPGGADVASRAQRYMSEGRDDSAVNLLEESLQLKGSDSLAPQWRSLLDQALYRQGKKRAQAGKYRDAVTSFARISPTFAKHEEVEKLISEYADRGLPTVFGRGEEGESTSQAVEKGKLPLSKLEKAVMTAVPGGKQHVDLLPSSIRQPVQAPVEQPGRQ